MHRFSRLQTGKYIVSHLRHDEAVVKAEVDPDNLPAQKDQQGSLDGLDPHEAVEHNENLGMRKYSSLAGNEDTR